MVPVPHPSDVRRTLDALRRIVQTLRTAGRAGERRVGLSSAQLFALQRIADHPGASVNDIAARTFTHQSSVSVVIQRLVEQGLVAKVPAPDDRRRQLLAVTAAGQRVLQRAPAVVQDRLIEAIAALPAAERHALSASLERVARFLAPEPAPPAMLFEDGAGRRPPGTAGKTRRTRNLPP
jgi:DNA-binding MarR family transcriptional regulator